MPDLLRDTVQFGLIGTLTVMLFVAVRGRSQQAASGYRREAELHRDLAEAQADLAHYSFDADDGKTSARLALVDSYREIAENRERAAAELDHLARWPFHRRHRSQA
jgi:hypothetical protein